MDILEEAKSIHQWIPWPEDHYSKEIKGDDTQDNDEEGNSGACSLLDLLFLLVNLLDKQAKTL